MTENQKNENEEKAPPVRKAKTGAWWKSVSKTPTDAPATAKAEPPAMQPAPKPRPEPEPVIYPVEQEQHQEDREQTIPPSGITVPAKLQASFRRQ
jgi:ribonuclease E